MKVENLTVVREDRLSCWQSLIEQNGVRVYVCVYIEASQHQELSLFSHCI